MTPYRLCGFPISKANIPLPRVSSNDQVNVKTLRAALKTYHFFTPLAPDWLARKVFSSYSIALFLLCCPIEIDIGRV